MILFVAFSFIYAGLLTIYIPAPEGLKERRATFGENLVHIKGTLAVGLALLSVFFVTSGFGFIQSEDRILALLSISNDGPYPDLWFLQFLTNPFIHLNVVHVLSNVAAIGIASAYERRVGTGRFFAVLLCGAFVSGTSVLFYSEPIISNGISGGVFALAAAYFTDHEDLTGKEWLQAVAMFGALMLVFSLEGEVRASSGDYSQIQVDHIGHVLGAIAGGVYVRLRPSIRQHQKKQA